jgi:hypothetical protein
VLDEGLEDALSTTHYPRPYRPPAEDLKLMRRFGELIGQAIEASLEADGQPACSRFGELVRSS